MLVFEYQCKLKFLKNISHKTIAGKINYFLDSVLAKDQEFLQYHEHKGYKYYVTDAPWPIEKDGIYKEGKVYTLRIRTVKQELAEFFSEKLYAHTSKELLGVGGKLRIIPKKHIQELYSITPIVIKNEGFTACEGLRTVRIIYLSSPVKAPVAFTMVAPRCRSFWIKSQIHVALEVTT